MERQMYELTEAFLHTKGYERYEISNYAKPGYECRHNCGYWTRKDYLGLGLGASSLVEHQRFQNTSNLKEYLEQEYISADQTCLNQKGMDEQNELDCRLSGNETVLPRVLQRASYPYRNIGQKIRDGRIHVSGAASDGRNLPAAV